MEFKEFAKLIRTRFDFLSKNDKLYVVDVTKDELWGVYLKSFPEGTNPVYKERTEHDCNTCKNFIRDVGDVVAMVDGAIQTIWDVKAEAEYLTVSKAMSDYIRSKPIKNVFLHFQNTSGAEKTLQQLEDKTVITWNHFNCSIPQKFVNRDPETVLGTTRTKTEVFERGLKEISVESMDIVIELIQQNSLYRGQQYLESIKEFKKLKIAYDKIEDRLQKNIFLWTNVHHNSSYIKNYVIGTLLSDLTEGYDLDDAVKSFETKVAPTNYKRPTAPVTKGMVELAMKTIQELGIEQSLQRRYAVPEDITINNVLFTDAAAKQVIVKNSLSDSLMKEATSTKKDFSKVEEVDIDKFIETILPNISKMQVLVEPKLTSNLVSLVAPADAEAPNILKWDNNFSWSYIGDITDSIKERVKKAGGKVDGYMRVSLSWFNRDDLDLHVVTPSRNEIYFNTRQDSITRGILDVDMNVHGESTDPVENITWNNKGYIESGKYKVFVTNFTKRETKDIGFEIEFEVNGVVTNYSYKKPMRGQENKTVFTFDFDKNLGDVTEIKVEKDIDTTLASKEIWGIKTNEFVDVSLMSISPNYWNEQQIGNKHYFFFLKDCKNPEETRGLYNEFLNGKLDKHRKVFEVIGNKLRCPVSDRQLSGIGFSSTKKETLVCKVEGKFARTLKIKF